MSTMNRAIAKSRRAQAAALRAQAKALEAEAEALESGENPVVAESARQIPIEVHQARARQVCKKVMGPPKEGDKLPIDIVRAHARMLCKKHGLIP